MLRRDNLGLLPLAHDADAGIQLDNEGTIGSPAALSCGTLFQLHGYYVLVGTTKYAIESFAIPPRPRSDRRHT